MNMKKLLIILLVVIGFSTIFILKHKQRNKRSHVKIPIILYHNFVTEVPNEDSDNFNYINTPQSFEENIKVILERGYTVISMKTLDDAYNGKIELPSKPILIHFDDGYYSNYEYIYPILKKYNVKASIYVVTDNIGKEINGIKYLGWEQCLEMQNSGLVEIYSHSKKHIFYNRVSTIELRDDVLESYRIIESKLGIKKLKPFVYPYGACTKTMVTVLRMNGIDMQVYDLGINYFDTFNKNHIKRINIPCEMTGEEIIEEIERQ